MVDVSITHVTMHAVPPIPMLYTPPSTLLLNNECPVKLADIGLACRPTRMKKEPSPVLTDYTDTHAMCKI